MREMRRPSGYEYGYGFSVEDGIIPLYPTQLSFVKKQGLKSYLFEIRTEFKLKRVDLGDEIEMRMGSERFGACVAEGHCEWYLEDDTSFRLKDDYWMSDDEIQSLYRDAMDFARRMAATAAGKVIPVVVGLDVWTVQQPGEPITAAIDRAIRPQSLIPIDVWPIVPKKSLQLRKSYMGLEYFLWRLERIRVEMTEEEEEEQCCVCSRNFVSGAQVSYLPCAHACHSLCVFRLLDEIKRDSCPKCGFRIPSLESQNSYVSDDDL